MNHMPEKETKSNARFCVDCGKPAEYKIDSYCPTYFCKAHAEVAKKTGKQVVEI